VPKDKLVALKSQLQIAAQSTKIRARSLASITGKIISMSIEIGPLTRLMTRSMYALLSTRQFWCQQLPLTIPARNEISFWLAQVDNFNGQGIWHTPSAVRVVYADASAMGYAGYTVEHGCHIAHGPWTTEGPLEQVVTEMLNSLQWKPIESQNKQRTAPSHVLQDHSVYHYQMTQGATN